MKKSTFNIDNVSVTVSGAIVSASAFISDTVEKEIDLRIKHARNWQQWANLYGSLSIADLNTTVQGLRAICQTDKEKNRLQKELKSGMKKSVYAYRKENKLPALFLWACNGNKKGLIWTVKPEIVTAKSQKNGKILSAKTSSNIGADTITQEEKSTLEKAILLDSLPAQDIYTLLDLGLADGSLDIKRLYAILDNHCSREKVSALKLAKIVETSKKVKQDKKSKQDKRSAPSAEKLGQAFIVAQQAKQEKEVSRKTNAIKIEKPMVDAIAFGG